MHFINEEDNSHKPPLELFRGKSEAIQEDVDTKNQRENKEIDNIREVSKSEAKARYYEIYQ